MATYIDNIVKFHTFSKAPVRGDLTLGEAVNPSGHTIVTSQVRAQDIPAFLNSFQGDRASALTWITNNVKTPRHNDIVYYGAEFKAGFTKPSCLKYNGTNSTWEDFDLNAATTLKNADDKEVITIHKNCTVAFVDGGNNANTNSNRNSLFVKRADGSILDHFVAATDKIHEGQPSLGYNALVLWKGAAMDEGEGNDNYIGNTFAGIVHLNKQYTTGDDTNNFKVTCYEYTGEKLDETITGIDTKIEDIVGATLNGVVASVTADATAKAAGIDVDSSTATSPVITLTTGTIGGDSDAKLVTGSTVKAYVDTAETDATNAAVNTINAKSLAATSTGSTQVTVKSTGTVGSGIALTVETSDIASAQALAQLTETVNTHITNAAGNLSVSVVDSLPTTGETNKIYLVPSADPGDQNVKDEYIWTNNAWELIGSTAVDLTGYATEAYVGTEIGKVTAVTDDHEGRIDAIEAAVPTHALKTTSLADEASSADGKVTIKTTGTLESGLSVEVTTDDIASAATVSALSQTVASNASTTSTGISEAKAAAEAAQTTADEAKSAASANSTAVATAQQTAEAAQSAANTADDKAEAAQDAADTAQVDATQALTDAAAAKAAADAAQADATAAGTAAAAAQTTADAKVASVTGGGNGITVTGDKDVEITVGAINTITDTNKESETVVTAKAVTAHVASEIATAGANYASNDTEQVAADAATAAATAQSTANAAKTAAQTAQTTADSKVAQTDYDAKVAELEEAISTAAPSDYIKTVTVGSTTTSGETTLTIKDGRDTVYANDLWGTTVSIDNNTITVQGGPIDATDWANYYSSNKKITLSPKGSSTTYSVSDNKLKNNSGTVLANIKTDELVNGSYMFNNTSLTSFSGDLSSLVNGSYMFSYTSLTSFSGDLSSLVSGYHMFSSTSLDVESVELICDVLPNYNTDNGGQPLQTCTWDGKKYTYTDWTSGTYYYPIINISYDGDSMSSGNTDGIDRTFGTESISQSDVKSIRITWKDISILSADDRTAITKLFGDTATEKGWTFITNTELGGTLSPNTVMTTDGTIQYYVLAKKDEATEDDATHIDANGKLWKFDTAEAIIGPNVVYWSMFATVEDALTEWELTPYVKPTEEETEA